MATSIKHETLVSLIETATAGLKCKFEAVAGIGGRFFFKLSGEDKEKAASTLRGKLAASGEQFSTSEGETEEGYQCVDFGVTESESMADIVARRHEEALKRLLSI